MKPESRDQAYLWDMLQATDEARELCEGVTFKSIERSALAGYVASLLTDLERATAEREGWILGVM